PFFLSSPSFFSSVLFFASPSFVSSGFACGGSCGPGPCPTDAGADSPASRSKSTNARADQPISASPGRAARAPAGNLCARFTAAYPRRSNAASRTGDLAGTGFARVTPGVGSLRRRVIRAVEALLLARARAFRPPECRGPDADARPAATEPRGVRGQPGGGRVPGA